MHLVAADKKGDDEIYATPAISNGRIYFVTRDRTICVGPKETNVQNVEIPKLVEGKGSDKVVSIRVMPFETRTMGGGKFQYTVKGYNELGQYVKDVDAQFKVPESASGVVVDSNNLVTVAAEAPEQGIEIEVTSGEHKAFARLRTFPNLPWAWDFEGYKPKQVPVSWINAFLKLAPNEIEKTMALKRSPGKGRPSTYFWLGHPDMKNYTVQTDVYMTEQKRKLPNMGVTVQRYNVILKGNTSKFGIQSWAPHLRMAKEVRYLSLIHI